MNRFIFKNLVFPLMEIQAKTTIKKDLDFLNKSQWWSKEDINKLQDKKLRFLIQNSYRNIPYYHKLFRENKISPGDIRNKEDLKKIPVLTKDIVRKNLSDLLLQNFPKSGVVSGKSSGSTGKPFSYYLNKEAYSAGWAQTFRCWGWAGFNPGDPYVKINTNPRLKRSKKIQDFLLNTLYIYSPHLSEKLILEEIDRIKKFRPRIIRGYASHMYAVARLMRDMDIYYHGAVVATTGDMLFQDYRETIERQFNCKVFDAYGGEGIPVSYECDAHSGYHIADEDVAVEFLNGENNVSEGETGRIVLTNLNNYYMPFIRYEINDLGRPQSGECACGRHLSMMKQIDGRDSDIIVTPSGDMFFLQFFKVFFKSYEGIDEYQVVQDKKDSIIVKIIRNNSFRDNNSDDIIKRLGERTDYEMKISIEFVENIPVYGNSEKKRVVISKLSAEN